MDSDGIGGMNMKTSMIILAVQLLALLLWIPLGQAAKRGDEDAVPQTRDS